MISDPLLGVSRGGLGWEERAVSFGVQLRHTDDAPKTVSLSQKYGMLAASSAESCVSPCDGCQQLLLSTQSGFGESEMTEQWCPVLRISLGGTRHVNCQGQRLAGHMALCSPKSHISQEGLGLVEYRMHSQLGRR